MARAIPITSHFETFRAEAAALRRLEATLPRVAAVALLEECLELGEGLAIFTAARGSLQ